MRFERAIVGLMLAMPMAVLAHPGHVYHPGLVHGYSWLDLLGLLAIVAVPLAFAWQTARRRNGRDD